MVRLNFFFGSIHTYALLTITVGRTAHPEAEQQKLAGVVSINLRLSYSFIHTFGSLARIRTFGDQCSWWKVQNYSWCSRLCHRKYRL